MINKETYLFLLLLLASMTGCQIFPINFNNDFQELDMPLSEMNKEMRLSKPPVYNIGDPFTFELRNRSDSIIYLSKDFDAKLFMRYQDNWKPIENCAIYSPGEHELFPKKENPIDWILISVNPCYSTSGADPVTFRIFVFGRLEGNDPVTNKKIGAWIDVKINP